MQDPARVIARLRAREDAFVTHAEGYISVLEQRARWSLECLHGHKTAVAQDDLRTEASEMGVAVEAAIRRLDERYVTGELRKLHHKLEVAQWKHLKRLYWLPKVEKQLTLDLRRLEAGADPRTLADIATLADQMELAVAGAVHRYAGSKLPLAMAQRVEPYTALLDDRPEDFVPALPWLGAVLLTSDPQVKRRSVDLHRTLCPLAEIVARGL